MRVPKDSYIHRHPGSANLWYVRDIPANIRHLLPQTKNGKQPTKWKISLKTAIRREAAVKAHSRCSMTRLSQPVASLIL
jgi:hypothetical protein